MLESERSGCGLPHVCDILVMEGKEIFRGGVC